LQFIDALAFDEVILVGQDSGGMICRFAAEKRPEIISALCLCGTEIPEVHSPLVSLFSKLAKLPGAKMMFKLNMGNRFLARTPLILGGTVYNKSLLDGELRNNLLEPILADDSAMQAMVIMIRDFSYSDVDALAQTHTKYYWYGVRMIPFFLCRMRARWQSSLQDTPNLLRFPSANYWCKRNTRSISLD